MGQKREEVEKAARNCPVVHAYLREHQCGMADYETALEGMVLHLAAERADLIDRVIELTRVQHPMHIVMPGPPCSTE